MVRPFTVLFLDRQVFPVENFLSGFRCWFAKQVINKKVNTRFGSNLKLKEEQLDYLAGYSLPTDEEEDAESVTTTPPPVVSKAAIQDRKKESLKCQFCSATFAEVRYRTRHEEDQSRGSPIPCNTCDMVFNQKCVLIKHKKTHIRLNRECGTCGKKFASSSHLQQHEMTHSTEQPFKCDICKISMKYKHSWKRPMRTQHK